MSTQTKRRRRHGKKLAEPVFRRRRVLARKGKALVLMDRLDRSRELNAVCPTVGQVAYARQIATAADVPLSRAQDLIDVIALAITHPDFGKSRCGGEGVADSLGMVLAELERVRDVLFPAKPTDLSDLCKAEQSWS